MLNKHQWAVLAVIVGLPFFLFVLLTLINPGYMVIFFEPNGFFDGVKVLIGLGIVNFFVMYSGLQLNNKRNTKLKTAEPPRYPCREIALILLCFIVFTLPSLWIVLLYPAVLQVLRGTY